MLSPYAYQSEAAETAIRTNTIINIKTGGGKTLIAVLVAQHFLEKCPNKNIMFLVPSRALVAQQAQYLRQHIRTSRTALVAEMCGQEMESWTLAKWQSALRDYKVFVGTAEVFRKALVDQGYLHASCFSLLVFDECHNAVGNAPMASLLRDAIHPMVQDQPRILGLTASFVNGSLKNIIAKRRKLEEVMQANIISPEVTEVAVIEKTFHYIKVSPEDLVSSTEALESYTSDVLSLFPRHLFDDRERNRQTQRGSAVFAGLGMDGYVFWLREGIVLQLIAEADELSKRSDYPCQNRALRIKRSLQDIQSILRSTKLPSDVVLCNPPPITQKCLRLLELLFRLYNNNIDNFRGIVFVEQIAMTYPLAYVVNNYFAQYYVSPDDERVWPMLPISGSNSMLDSVRNDNLTKFRSGLVPLLVSTPSLEEGIDVPECSFIIRYDGVMTTKAHIQGSGRARQSNAEIYYFQNDPSVECTKASYLEEVARNNNLNITDFEMKLHIQETAKTVVSDDFVYPYHPPGIAGTSNQVNFFNCLTILYEYVQGVMKQSFNPEKSIYSIKEEIVSRKPLEIRKKIAAVSYPTPCGVRTITRDEVDNFWRDRDVSEVVVPADRLRNLKMLDIDKRRFVYYVVISLHRENLLLDNNRPTPAAKAETKHKCPIYMMEDRIRIRDNLKPEVLHILK